LQKSTIGWYASSSPRRSSISVCRIATGAGNRALLDEAGLAHVDELATGVQMLDQLERWIPGPGESVATMGKQHSD
jgi:hypothetical protein